MVGTMQVMNRSGDTRVIWDSTRPAEVENAERTFDELRGQGYLAYTVDAGGARGNQIREFDPEAEKIILAPPLRGG